MDNDEKIQKLIREMENEGVTRDEIVRGAFVSKKGDGTFTVYKLSKSGKKNYNLNVLVGAINLDDIDEK